MNKSKIVRGFIFKMDEKFAKTVKKRMHNFDNTTLASKNRISLLFSIFLTRDRYELYIYLFTAAISCIHTEILWVFRDYFLSTFSEYKLQKRTSYSGFKILKTELKFIKPKAATEISLLWKIPALPRTYYRYFNCSIILLYKFLSY